MLLSISHRTTYRYLDGATDAAFRLRLTPPDGAIQRVLAWGVTINGQQVAPGWTNAYDVAEGFWRAGQRIVEAVICAEGVVETTDCAGVIGKPREMLNPRVFLKDSRLTRADPAIERFALEAHSHDGTLATLHALCRHVNEALDYRTEVTDSSTTAERVMELGAGVCQDFAHLFIAAARVLRIPCRYVAGYLHDPAIEDSARASHGWVEAFVDELGWIGFDPTRKICITGDYIRLSTGFDAFDAAPIRGVTYAAANVAMQVDLDVQEGQLQTQALGQSQTQQQ